MTLDRYELVKADFPSAEAESRAWVDALQKDAAGKTKTMSLDRLEASVGVHEAEQRADRTPLRNDPPTILISNVPAILVYVDGPPSYKPVAGTSLECVINTRPLLLKDAGGKHYLHVFDGWTAAPAFAGPYAGRPLPRD